MNIKTLAEQAHRILAGGTPTVDNDIDEREVELKVRQNCDKVLTAYIYEYNRGLASFTIPADCINSTSLTVSNKTATIGFGILSLPKDHGILEVRQTGDCEGTSAIYPVSGRVGIVSGLDSALLEDNYGYRRTGKTLKFLNVGSATLKEVEMDYVPSAMGISKTEELIIPASLHNSIIEMTVKDFMPHLEIPQDKKLDNSDT